MLNLYKTLIADFHARGLPGKLVRRELCVPLDLPKVISIIGPRRAGKTYFLFSLIEHLRRARDIRQMVYINFEDERLNPEAASLGVILDAYQQLYPDRKLEEAFFFFDEVQVVPGWEKFVRRIVDTVSPHVFVTGSSAKLLGREIAASLRGRTLAYTLFPFSFREYLRFMGHEADDIRSTGGRNRIEALFDRFLGEGGYPETLGVDDTARLRTLQSYFEIMLYRDVVERHALKRPHLVKDFARRLLAGNAQVFSVHKYYRDLRSRNVRVTKDALYALADHFADACFVAPVVKFDPSVAKQEQALKKYYVNDTGLLTACAFLPGENHGALLETFARLELRKRERAVAYFSDKVECDFLLLDRGEVKGAIQVCWELTAGNRDREIAGLVCAMKRFKLAQGFILTRRQDEEIRQPPGVVTVMPAWKWALSLDAR